MIHDRLGQTVLSYRKKNKMTIREFADYAGISTSLISQIERGHANPSLSGINSESVKCTAIYTIY